MNRLIGVVGMALSGAALVTVICVTALLLDGVTVLFRFGSFAAIYGLPQTIRLIEQGAEGELAA